MAALVDQNYLAPHKGISGCYELTATPGQAVQNHQGRFHPRKDEVRNLGTVVAHNLTPGRFHPETLQGRAPRAGEPNDRRLAAICKHRHRHRQSPRRPSRLLRCESSAPCGRRTDWRRRQWRTLLQGGTTTVRVDNDGETARNGRTPGRTRRRRPARVRSSTTSDQKRHQAVGRDPHPPG